MGRERAWLCLGMRGRVGELEAVGNINKWFPQDRREELTAPGPSGWGRQEEGLINLHLCPFRRGERMELERIVSAALLAFVQTHLPEADLR